MILKLTINILIFQSPNLNHAFCESALCNQQEADWSGLQRIAPMDRREERRKPQKGKSPLFNPTEGSCVSELWWS